ncbi:MAG TPA: neuraminidase-like domain-containing protein, partial [Thermodesulfobacteriota bacterium]|nr:neuraminidase-like domain-containing protein [Thermodesulfobacteriota bacterium]
QRPSEGAGWLLHIFAATSDNPPVYYYRAVDFGLPDGFGYVPAVWRAWRKVDVKIPVREVSPIVYNNRLYLFWCEIVTTQQNATREGSSYFVGYTHKMAVNFSCLNADGRWAPPQQISLLGPYPFQASDGVIEDPLIEPGEMKDLVDALKQLMFSGAYSAAAFAEANKNLTTPRYEYTPHPRAIEGYTLRGEEWQRVYPEVWPGGISLVGSGYQLVVTADLFSRSIRPADEIDTAMHRHERPHRVALNKRYDTCPYVYKNHVNDSTLYFSYGWERFCLRYAFAQFMADPAMRNRLKYSVYADPDSADQKAWSDLLGNLRQRCGTGDGSVVYDEDPLVTVPPDASVRVFNDTNYYYVGQIAMVRNAGGTVLLRFCPESNAFSLYRADSTVPNDLARILYTGGLEGLLTLGAQRLPEPGCNGVGGVPGGMAVVSNPPPSHIDFTGPMGVYYWELYFHMPMAIASLLNSQARYEDARKWFHYVFDPTASAAAPDLEERKNRMWRFLPFRADGDSVHKMLRDSKALDAYRKNPFSPHAIARLRSTAYKKSVVMQYVENLLDWGDSLFLQFQMETVNEAVMLYNLAADILGPRPPELGPCSEEPMNSRNYAVLETAVADAGEWDFLVELEHETEKATYSGQAARKWRSADLLKWGRIAVPGEIAASRKTPYVLTHVDSGGDSPGTPGQSSPGKRKGVDAARPAASWTEHLDLSDIAGGPGFQPTLAAAPFCLPVNRNLLDLWNRVEDRLYKIRHCLDIDGQRRDLALFAPEIDPGLLIRARAEGIPLGDILDVLTDRVPP